jgi:hypothetical protein
MKHSVAASGANDVDEVHEDAGRLARTKQDTELSRRAGRRREKTNEDEPNEKWPPPANRSPDGGRDFNR